MAHYNYLIVGGGMTGAAAVKGIRSLDEEGKIALISAEAHAPYNRPPLSKGLWQDTSEDDIWRKLPDDVTLLLGRRATKLDLEEKQLLDDGGEFHSFDKLLLATGGHTRKLPFGGEEIIYYRTLADYHQLRELTDQHNDFVVIGGGFIGSEVAAALAMNDKNVTMLFPEDGICARLFPTHLAEYLNDYYREKGVTVKTGEAVNGLEGSVGDLTVHTKNGETFTAQGVIAGIGIIPNTQLAEEAGLKVDNGIVVDERLQTSHEDVYAAGDVASYFDTMLETRRRVEHEDNALTQGQMAGRIMAGDENLTYDYSPLFYSDMFDLGYEAVGRLDSRLDIIEDWQEKYKEGVLYYVEDGFVRGVLLWNVWGRVEMARQIIASDETYTAEDLKGQIA